MKDATCNLNQDMWPFHHYRPQTKFAKIMFLHVSVSHSVHRGGVHGWGRACMAGGGQCVWPAGGMHGGGCMVGGAVHGTGVCVAQGGVHGRGGMHGGEACVAGGEGGMRGRGAGGHACHACPPA